MLALREALGTARLLSLCRASLISRVASVILISANLKGVAAAITCFNFAKILPRLSSKTKVKAASSHSRDLE